MSCVPTFTATVPSWVPIGSLVVSGVAAFSALFSVIYSAGAARRKADRELLASKLESLFDSLREECTRAVQSVDLVINKLADGTPPEQIYELYEETLRPVWSEANAGEILVSLYFPELLEEFTAFRSNRSAIGTIFKGLPRAPFSAAMNAALDIHTDKMVEAYG